MHNNIPDDFHFPYNTAMSCIHRDNLEATGKDSPLKKVEDQFVQVLLSMSKIKYV